MTHPVLQVTDLRKSYGDVEVLRGVDLRVDAGELIAVVGPSGSGKSTLLHLMGGLDRASSGAVNVEGRDVTSLSDRELAAFRARRLGFVFQSFHLLDGLTAVENVAHGLLYSGVARAERHSRAVEMLQRVGLGHRLEHLPRVMSGGERQRVAIARALLNRPAIVFADEPTGNLDSASGGEVLALLHDLQREGTTILVITHDHEVAATMQRQVEIRDGLIRSDSRTGSRNAVPSWA